MNVNKIHKTKEIKLSSGAKLLNVIVPDFPVSIVSAWFRAGSRFDPKGKEGLAHFFEHLMMIKTKKYSDRRMRIKALESRGILFNAFTTNELSYYYQIQLPGQVYDSLGFLIDGLNQTKISNKDIQREKEVIINEESQNYLSPSDYIWRLSRYGLWPKSDLGRDFFGDNKTVNGIKIGDINNFKDKYYTADNLFFVVVSSEPINKLKKYIDKKYKPSIKIGDNNRFKDEVFTDPEKIKIDKRDSDQVNISINYRTTSVMDFKEVVVLDFIKNCMANTWISRLVDALRVQNNITYWVEGDSEYFSDAGYLSFSFSVNPKKVNQALDISFKEVEKIKSKKMSKKDLENYKISYKSTLIRHLMNPYEILWWYGHAFSLGNKIMNPNDYIKLLESLTVDDIKKVANKFLIEKNLSIAFIGPVDKKSIKINI